VKALRKKKMTLTNAVAFTNSIRNLVLFHSSGLPTRRICEVLVRETGISQNPVTQKCIPCVQYKSAIKLFKTQSVLNKIFCHIYGN
jgi:hypothetical protein